MPSRWAVLRKTLEPALLHDLSRGKSMAKALLEVSDARKEEYPQAPKWLEVFQCPSPRALKQ